MSNLQDPHSKQASDTERLSAAKQPLHPRSDRAAHKPVSKRTIWLSVLMIGVLMIGVLLGKYWGNDDDIVAGESSTSNPEAGAQMTDSSASTEQSVLSVETITPSQTDIGNTLSADGTINAKDTANVSAKVTGVAIERVLVEEGDRVKAGQVLAVFDTDAMQQQVLQAQADVAEAQATLANASADAARILPLLDIDAISKQEADRYRTSQLRAAAALQASKARFNTQRLTLKNAKVVAPVSGIISDKMVEVGMVAGGEPLFTIIKGGILEWRADIDPKLIGDIRVGTPVQVSLPSDRAVMGQVSRIAPTADNNRQITIYVSLAADSMARAGMYQTGEFLLGSARMQTIPNSAIVSNDGYDYVMLVVNLTTQDGKTVGRIKQQRVALGVRFGDSVAVTEPLPSDSQIVNQGGGFLNDGDLVHIVNRANETKNPDTTADKTTIAQARS